MKTQSTLSKPVGVRLSPDDVSFLNEAWPSLTSSKALRLALEESRNRRKLPLTQEEAYERLMESLGGLPAICPAGLGRSSVVEGLVRDTAILLAEVALLDPVETHSSLEYKAFEKRIVSAGMDIMEALLRQALSPAAGAWDPAVVRVQIKKLRPLLIETLSALSLACLPSAPQSGEKS